MQSYDVKCEGHGTGETVGSMRQAIDGTLPCFVDGCLSAVVRFYPRGKYAHDHTEITFKPWHSEQLTLGDNPVYVKSRAEEKGMMDSMGLQRWEPGMKSAAAEQSEANRRRKERAKREAR